ncbi:MAG: ParA family protein [Agarilytica sp.]
MEQVFVTNPKGGAGKTTISTHIAAYFANQNKNVLLVDHDALKCSSDWHRGRPASYARLRSVTAKVDDVIDFGDADWVVHDMPAAWTLENVQNILHAGDRVLIPVLSSPNDIKACLRFVMNLHRSGILESGVQVGLIANRVRANTSYFKILKEFLSRLGLPIVTTLRDTQNYVLTMDAGLTIFDLPPSRVKQDLAQWKPVINWLRKSAPSATP